MPRKTAAGSDNDRGGLGGFNEAAARCRGKPPPGAAAGHGWPSFNEAAARCRGKPAAAPRPPPAAAQASMRPRPDAAENDVRRPAAVPAPWSLQ